MKDREIGMETLRSLQSRFLRAIREGRWSEAHELQDRRFALMDLLLDERMTPALAAELQAIAARDRELLPQVELAREQVAGELREIGKARKAMSAYGFGS